MKLWIRWFGALVAVSMALALAALAEEMPVVDDEPLTAREQAAQATDPVERTRQAQQMLIDLSLLDGTPDGAFGPKTASSVLWFQEKYNLPMTGTLDDRTFEALIEKSAEANANKAVQQRLIDLGYLRGSADGIFGERSVAALKLFQALQGLEATGEPDGATLAALNAEGLATVPARLKTGDKGDAVKALQERLIQFAFLNDRADGNYGPATTAAVKRFQNHLLAQGVDANLGIEATGEATSATQLMLFSPEYSSYLTDLAPGAEGSEVLRVERRLSQLGYLDATPDETLDNYAARCVAAFKAAARVGLGGTADKATFDALFSDGAPAAEHYVLHDIAYKDRGTAIRVVEELLLTEGMTIKQPNGRYDDTMRASVEQLYAWLAGRGDPNAALFADPEILTVEAQDALQKGALENVQGMDMSNEADVKRVQRRLHTLFYIDRFSIDGKFADGTRNALSLFQSTNGLPATGEADAATLEKLFSEEALTKRLPYRVEISLDNQRIYVYELNAANEYEQTQEFKCSTGLGNSTPRGIFLDAYPANTWHYFEKFNCWAKYSFEVEGNIMIHSVLFDDNDSSTLRENSLYALGQKASHGCIRLKVSDAYWLFSHCKRGTLVIVIY